MCYESSRKVKGTAKTDCFSDFYTFLKQEGANVTLFLWKESQVRKRWEHMI